MKRAVITITPLLVTVALAASVLFAARPVRASALAPWSDSLADVGMPASPAQWQPSNWDVQIHTRDAANRGDAIDAQMADHGADCAPPPAQHRITRWQQAVFACHNHVMTAISDEGYGEVVLTPDHLADWSTGPVTIGFSVSTQKLSQRDWWALDITPFSEQLALPFDEGGVDLQGMPRHYIEVRLDNCGNDSVFRVARESSVTGDEGSYGEQQGVSDCLQGATGIAPSATVRTPFELTVSATGYTFRVKGGATLVSGAWTKPLTFSRGVVQFIHHAYNPAKCDGCQPDTWHWSDFSISSAVPYTLLRPADHQVVTEGAGVVTFAAPAPVGSYLKFAAIGSIQVSYDGGRTYHAARKPPLDAALYHDEHFTSYLDPVPAGVSRVLWRVSGGWFGAGMARDFSLVSATSPGGPPPPPPSPTATPIPPTVTPTATPSPIPSPTPQSYDGPCTVILNNQPVSGMCRGTFEPLFP